MQLSQLCCEMYIELDDRTNVEPFRSNMIQSALVAITFSNCVINPLSVAPFTAPLNSSSRSFSCRLPLNTSKNLLL